MRRLIAALFLSLAALGVNAKCDSLYPEGKPIKIKNTVELCNSWYVAVYSVGKRRTEFVSEILDAKTAKASRNDSFRKDARVKWAVSPSELNRSGYDRGHLVPADDSSNQKEMDETFLMTNVVPQAPKLNRGQWRTLETYIRTKAKGQAIHVFTGAIYGTKKHDAVPVPSAMYKVVYLPRSTEYWYAENEDKATVRRVTKLQLERDTGISFP